MRYPAKVRAWVHYVPALAEAWRGETVHLGGMPVLIPGPRRIRLSVVGGNVRMHRLFDAALQPGATLVDVGANIGYNALYAAALVGPAGRVIAVEPAADNVAILQRNVEASGLRNVAVAHVAAGGAAGTRDFFLRGDVSAVNSFFAASCYAAVTGVVQVPVTPLDDLVAGDADVVKIDVEGAELEVLAGMPRLLRNTRLQLIVEWHPALQEAAGCAADALPRWLLDQGFRLRAATHFGVRALSPAGISPLAAKLLRTSSPVELIADRWSPAGQRPRRRVTDPPYRLLGSFRRAD
jgi:FkbM family methyltransferase